jgi:intein/homing endonuclease
MSEPRNPYNPNSELYRKLTTLLSGPIAKYKQQSPSQLKRIELNKYKFTSASGASFRKEFYGDVVDSLRLHTLMNQNRLQRYTDYDSMEFVPEIHSSLDIYVDEITYSNSLQPLLKINCPNSEIKSILRTLFYDVLNIEQNLFSWVRSTVKYGDFFLYLDIDPKLGVKGGIGLPVREIERMEGTDKTNPTYVQFQWNSGGLTFENWQMAHFRILGIDKYAPYGTSILDGARRVFRQYILLQDAIISYRIVRCLHGDSDIWTPEGYKKIKDVRKGDKIFSYDKDNQVVLSNVTDWINNGEQQIWSISSKHREIKANENHPILVRNKKTELIEYVNVADIIPQVHQFVLPEQDSPLFEDILSCSATDEYSDVFDIRVDNDCHNFIANGCVVHNSPERRVFYIDVGGIEPKDVEEYIQKVITSHKRHSIVDENTGNVDMRHRVMPISKDSPVPLLDGRTLTIEQVAREFEEKKDLWTYSVEDGTNRLVPGKVVWCGKNYTANKLIKVWLDDNSHILTAPEHPFILRDGTQKRADELKVDDSLMPFPLGEKEKKVSRIEVVEFPEGHDVYCMTIEGPRGEQDRHNFAVCSKRDLVGGGYEILQDGVIIKNSTETDFYLPIRGANSGTKIESLPGGSYTGDVDDLKIFRDQLFSALKVPASYLVQSEGMEDKTTLAQKDIRFARTIQRLQRSVVAELTKLAVVHLFTLGFRGEDLLKFELSLNNPSKIAEMQELDFWNTKLDVASSAKEFFSTRWISSNILGLTEEEWLRIQRERFYDAKMDAAMESAGESEGGGMGGGFSFGGEEPAGTSVDDEFDEFQEDIGEEPEEAPEEDTLLAAPDMETEPELPPGKKESEDLYDEPKPGKPHLTPGSKGKEYTGVTNDKRPHGARKRHEQGKYSKELTRNTKRNVFKGLAELQSLAYGIAESKKEEDLEKEIFKTNYGLKTLLERLENSLESKEQN